MADIELQHVDETYIRIVTSQSIFMDLKEQFSFFVPNYKFHPKFRSGFWDGRISLINWKTKCIYKGLLPDVVQWADENGTSVEIDSEITDSIPQKTISTDKGLEFYRVIGGPFVPHKSQLNAFTHCVNNGRSIILAPTNNGKSYIIHGLNHFYSGQGLRVLVIVDRAQLVLQLKDNFVKEYNSRYSVSTVYDDAHDGQIHITTWQSCYENDRKWFKQWDVIIGDEVHKFKATSLKALVDNCGHVMFRHGFTATLDNDSKTDRLTLIGMFGTPYRVSTVAQDIEDGISSEPTIYAIRLKYPNVSKIIRDHGTKMQSGTYKLEFQQEVDYIESHLERNQIIAGLVARLPGNTLIAFKRDEHGKALIEQLRLVIGNRPLYFINHTIDKNVRHRYSQEIDQLTDAAAVVSVGTFGTGVNIKNVNNIVIACQMNSKISVPQLIGRGVRLTETKKTVNIYDFGDDLSNQGQPNASYKHFQNRLQMYAAEGFKIHFKERDLR